MTKSEPIETNELCVYGCGNIALFKTKNNKLICQPSSNKCAAVRAKNSARVKQAHKEGKIPGWNILAKKYNMNRNWSKNLDRTDSRIKRKYTIEDLFNDSNRAGGLNLARKKFLIKQRGHICESCRNIEWLNLPITLELEHVDGNKFNNNFENIKLLCPNCHSLTPTWRRKKTSDKYKNYINEHMGV